MPLDVKSWPLMLTSIAKRPGPDTVVLQTMDVAFRYAAGTTVAFIRQRSAERSSSAEWKPLPPMVIGVPPSAMPRDGVTDETAATG
jgi:hypothetical protein